MSEDVFVIEEMIPGEEGEVSAVTDGANPGAHILLTKIRDSETSGRDRLSGNSQNGGKESGLSSKKEILLKLDPGQQKKMVAAAVTAAKEELARMNGKAEDDPPKGQPGDMTGGRARDRLRQLQSNGMSFQEISDQLDRMGESASRSPSVLGAILAGEIMNPPDDLLGFLRRVKPTEEDKEEASMSKEETILKAEIEKLKKQNGELEEENARLQGDHKNGLELKNFAETLPPPMQEAFLAMSPEEQEAFKAQFEAAAEGGSDLMAKFTKSFEKMDKENKDLRESLQKMQDEQNLSAAIKKFQDLDKVVEIEPFAKSYLKLHKAAPEDADAWVEKMRALSAQVDAGELFKIKGGDGDGTGSSAREKISQKVEKMREVDPKLSKSAATDMVLKANPDLYEQYRSERSA